MSTSQIQHLISMINQIASNNNYNKSDEETASFVANHIRNFWARSMKEQILEYTEKDGSELSNASKIALKYVSESYR